MGWKAAGFQSGAGWAPASASTTFNYTKLHAKMEPPLEFMEMKVTAIKEVVPAPPGPGPHPPHPPPAPPGPPATCVDVAEKRVADVGCPAGEVISSIDFANFGTPTGSCSAGFTVNPKCSSNHSIAVVTAACMGKGSCKVPASCDEFHEELGGKSAFCWDTIKSLAVKVSCKKQSAASMVTATSPPPKTSTSNTRSNSQVAPSPQARKSTSKDMEKCGKLISKLKIPNFTIYTVYKFNYIFINI